MSADKEANPDWRLSCRDKIKAVDKDEDFEVFEDLETEVSLDVTSDMSAATAGSKDSGSSRVRKNSILKGGNAARRMDETSGGRDRD